MELWIFHTLWTDFHPHAIISNITISIITQLCDNIIISVHSFGTYIINNLSLF